MNPRKRYEIRQLKVHNLYAVFDMSIPALDGRWMVYRGTETACKIWVDAVVDALEYIEEEQLDDRTETAEMEPVEAVPV